MAAWKMWCAWKTKHCWFRYLYPTAFLAAGLVRCDTVEGGIFVGVAVLLTCTAVSSCFDEFGRPWRRKLYLALCMLTQLILLASPIPYFMCLGGYDGPTFRRVLQVLGVGGPWESSGCASALGLLPELGASVAGMLGILLDGVRAPGGHSMTSRPRLSQPSTIMFIVGMLVACAMLDFNIPAACSKLAGLLMLLSFACTQPPESCPPGLAPWLRAALAALLGTDVVAAVLLQAARACKVEAKLHLWPALLGIPDIAGRMAQCICGFLLLQFILWCEPQSSQPTEAMRPACSVQLQRLPGGGNASAATALDDTAGCEEGGAGAAMVDPSLQLSTESSGVAVVPTSFSTTSTTTFASEVIRPAGTYMWRKMVYLTEAAASLVAASSLLPISSLLMWPMLWPCVATLPLLLGALALMYVPSLRVRLIWLRLALVHELIFGVATYAYNVYCYGGGDRCHAVSKVPAEFTWFERWGLQRLDRGGQWYLAADRVAAEAAQLISIVLLVIAIRQRARQPQLPTESLPTELRRAASAQRRVRGLLDMGKGCVLALSRAALAAFVIWFTLGSARNVSLLSFGYLLWLVGLGFNGYLVSEQSAGWDGLRGHCNIWRALFFYSSAAVVAQFCWQVFADSDLELLGLRRSGESVMETLWPHCLMAFVASLQVKLLRAEVSSTSSAADPSSSAASSFASLLTNFGIFVLMGLMLLEVTIPLVSIWSLLVLLLFVGVVAGEQFGFGPSWRRTFILATAFIAATQLLVCYAIMIPRLQSWILSPLPKDDYRLLWNLFAWDQSTTTKARQQAAATASLMLYSLFLSRSLEICRERHERNMRSEHSNILGDAVARAIAGVLREVDCMMPPFLLYISVLLLFLLPDLLSRVQLGVLFFLLLSGRGWNMVGGVMSVFSMISLLAQYVFQFSFLTGVMQYVDLEWAGLLWKRHNITVEAVLAVLGILHYLVKRALAFCCNAMQVRPVSGSVVGHSVAAGLDCSKPDLGMEALARRVRSALVACSPHIAAVLLLLGASFDNQARSLVNCAVVVGFAASKDCGRTVAAPRANTWLRLMALALTLALMYGLAVQSWPPLDHFRRPTPNELSKWWLCRAFDSKITIDDGGDFCNSGPDCKTQQWRCAETFEDWLGFSEQSWTFTGQFTVLFLICLLRRQCLQQLLAGRRVGVGAGRPLDFLSSSRPWQERQSPLLHQAEEVRPEASETERVPASTSFMQGALRQLQIALADLCRALMPEEVPAFIRWASSLGLWASCTAALVSQTQIDAIGVCYTLLVLTHAFQLQKSVLQSEKDAPAANQLVALVLTRWCSLSVFVFSALYQFPAAPCPYTMQLSLLGGDGVTLFTSPSQCAVLQEERFTRLGSAAQGVSKFVAILLQCVGITKRKMLLGFDINHFLDTLIFSFALMQAVALQHWHEDLVTKLGEEREFLTGRAERYKEHLQRWRHVERSRVDTKHEVLHLKLQALIHYLKELQNIWAGRRMAFSEEEKKNRERTQEQMDLSLQTGWSLDDIAQLIETSELSLAAASQEGSEEPELNKRPVATLQRSLIAECVLARVALAEDCTLRKITPATMKLRDQQLLDGYKQSLRGQKESEPVESSSRSCITQPLLRFLRGTARKVVDDHLFLRPDHGTLQEHMDDNPSWKLFFKMLWSNTFTLVFVAAVLQFAACQCVASSVTIFTLVFSLMRFPHAPAGVWQFLQVYNVLMLCVKMFYQTPLFCWNGSISFQECPDLDLSTTAHLTVFAILGLVKVQPTALPHSLIFSSLLGYLWADIVVLLVLFLHFRVLCNGGRMRYTPDEIRSALTLRIREDRSQLDLARLAGSFEDEDRAVRSPVTSSGEHLEAGGDGDAWWWKPLIEVRLAVERFALGGAQMRKPAWDLYSYRFVLSVACFCILLLCWSQLSGEGRTFAASLTSNVFSGRQVVYLIVFLATIVADRALYTLATQSAGAGAEDIQGQQARQELLAWAPILQLILLLAEVITLHVFCILTWSNSLVPTLSGFQMFNNTTLFLFYVLYITYLALTALQLKYDIHVVRGGLGLTHSDSFSSWLGFHIYTLIPFMEELRVLTDWTVMVTSLNFFMWMKLEDAHQNLYRVQCDMKGRRQLPKAAPRRMREKCLQGGLLLLGLFLLIVLPVLYFSTANFLLKPNVVVSAVLQVRLHVGSTRLVLYESSQATITSLDSKLTLFAQHPELGRAEDCSLQNVSFPSVSDIYWLASDDLRKTTAAFLNTTGGEIQIDYQLQTNLTTSGHGIIRLPLAGGDNATLAAMLQDIYKTGSQSVLLPCHDPNSKNPGLQEVIKVDSTGNIANLVLRPFHHLKMTIYLDSNTSFPQWFITESCEPCQKQPPTTTPPPSRGRQTRTAASLGAHSHSGGDDHFQMSEDCPVSFLVVSERVSPTQSSGSSGGSDSSYGVIGIYLGVVYTIGRFLRLAFQDSSKRMIYEELPDTRLLTDLCNGIYIARIAGDLDMEYEFYYELIHIYRSPELLLDVSRSRNRDEGGASVVPPAAIAGAGASAAAAPRQEAGPQGQSVSEMTLGDRRQFDVRFRSGRSSASLGTTARED